MFNEYGNPVGEVEELRKNLYHVLKTFFDENDLSLMELRAIAGYLHAEITVSVGEQLLAKQVEKKYGAN